MSTVLRLLAGPAPADVRLERPAAAMEPAPAPEARGLFEEAPGHAPPEFVYPDQEPINLGDFEPLTGEELAKLEVDCFANCANTMPYIGAWDGRPVPWIENFGNQNDIVARLGMLALCGSPGDHHCRPARRTSRRVGPHAQRTLPARYRALPEVGPPAGRRRHVRAV